jgi:hypothetical protein
MIVKRYDTDRDGEEYESETGPFVHFADYTALAAELAECAAVRDSWCAEFVKARDALARSQSDAATEQTSPESSSWPRPPTET